MSVYLNTYVGIYLRTVLIFQEIQKSYHRSSLVYRSSTVQVFIVCIDCVKIIVRT